MIERRSHPYLRPSALICGSLLLGVLCVFVVQHRTLAAPAERGVSIQEALARGARFLRGAQGKEGDWQEYPGITALAALALVRAGGTERGTTAFGGGAPVAKAMRYLVSQAKPNGAIYSDKNPATALPNYNTALAITALHAARNPAYAPVIRHAQEFLERSQFDEGEGFTTKDVAYGGIGYGSKPDKPDLSNLQQALEALKETNFASRAPLWDKAIRFLQRCQNRGESNDQAWAGNDGGFVYASDGESKAGGHSSYGSMTYAGLKSYIYCRVSRSDPRVQAAWNWLRARYTVQENPGMRDAGLYYYYHTMSKTLAVWGQRTLIDAAGHRHDWSADLSRELIARQAADGSWVNKNPRWWEDNPVLVTAYSMLALANCQKQLSAPNATAAVSSAGPQAGA
jgi:squalene-hopene/tetraprenyl-beta-curcumene cyclase